MIFYNPLFHPQFPQQPFNSTSFPSPIFPPKSEINKSEKKHLQKKL